MVRVKLSQATVQQAYQAAVIMNTSLDIHLTIEQLAKKVNTPPKKLKAVFKQVYGMGVYSYLRQQRMEVAKKMLLTGAAIHDIFPVIGYTNASNFSKAFRIAFQETPNHWRKKQAAIVFNKIKKIKTPPGIPEA